MRDVGIVKKKRESWRNKAEQTAVKDNSFDSSDGSSDSSESDVLFYEQKTQSLLCEHRNEWQSKWRKIRGKKQALCIGTETKLFSRFQALSTALLWNLVLRDVKLCSRVSGYGRFEAR